MWEKIHNAFIENGYEQKDELSYIKTENDEKVLIWYDQTNLWCVRFEYLRFGKWEHDETHWGIESHDLAIRFVLSL